VDQAFADTARRRLDSLAKPPGSLGRLEDVAARVAVVQGTERPSAGPQAIVVLAADHGVVAEGVSPYPQEVTAQMVGNFATGGAAISQLSAWAGARLVVADLGVVGEYPDAGKVDRIRIAPGTRNIVEGPAMSEDETAEAVLAGARIASRLVGDGVRVVGTGEMGIGNTTPAAAMAAVLCDARPREVVGPGTGLDDEGVRRKMGVVRRAIETNAPDPRRPFEVLTALGGLEIAGLVGVMLAGASSRACVVVDGFIAGVAALVATRMAPDTAGYLFAAHRSREPGASVVLEALGLDPLLDLEMRLGEGSGSALAMGVIAAACGVMNGMATFDEAGVTDRDGT
jgi:nicotinate-nucleotide--dimethylbenzimidazole phosphoribosyltransferase